MVEQHDASYFELLQCPKCSGSLTPSGQDSAGQHTALVCAEQHSIPIVGGIPRFVDSQQYTESFGYQWTRFRRIQLDSYNGTNFSRHRFETITGYTPAQLAGRLVLDGGCGAGRFADVVMREYGARLVACDLSAAVEACRDNLAPGMPFVCQASILDLPFRPQSFDFVYSIGVIQHTPDPEGSIRSLCRMVKQGGQVAIWTYELNWKCFVGTSGFKYFFRPLSRRLSRARQLALVDGLSRVCQPLVRLGRRCGTVGKIFTRMLPVAAAHLHEVDLTDEDLRNWVVLDTFDMYSPSYDSPQRFDRVARILKSEGFHRIERHPHGGLSITATRQ